MQCEICGRETTLYEVIVEGTELNVCKNCSSFGVVLREVKEEVQKEKRFQKPIKIEEENIQLIEEDYGKKVRLEREKMGLTQKELAQKISEKESVIGKVESETLEPSLRLAKKLENFLNIKLIVDYREEKKNKLDFSNRTLTIGDLVKLKNEER